MPTYDRRVEKTKQAIIEAMENLMEKKRYAQITVQEIIDEANVGRTTFYAHFPTKDDLLHTCIDKHMESFKGSDAMEAHIVGVAELFEHIQAHKKLIKGLLNCEVSDILSARCQSYIEKRLLSHLEMMGIASKDMSIPANIVSCYLTGSLFAIARQWMETGMKETPRELEVYFMTMAMPAIKEAFTKNRVEPNLEGYELFS